MRRQDLAITDAAEIRRILDCCHVVRLGLNDEGDVYIVPMNYGYTLEDGRLSFYLHGAPQGRKLDVLRRNNRVGFEMDCDHELRPASGPCGYSYHYSSIIGTGTVSILEEPAEKAEALNHLMDHFVENMKVHEKAAVLVSVLRLDVSEFTVKQQMT